MTRGEPLLSCVEVEPEGSANAAVIWLHGLGADGHDFEPIVPYLELAPGIQARFIFPHAPDRPVTVNAGMVMPAWYDIRVLALQREIDEGGVLESTEQVAALMARERNRGIAPGRLVLAGFSQGGAIALHAALRYPARLAGVIALSTYLVRDQTLEAERSEANHDLPIFQAHGTLDPMVPLENGERARDRLTEMGYPLEWRTYAMGHEVHPGEIRDVGSALNAWLNDQNSPV
jgi:phospholipase/carboxylesterase